MGQNGNCTCTLSFVWDVVNSTGAYEKKGAGYVMLFLNVSCVVFVGLIAASILLVVGGRSHAC
jgi:hypothetical protein